MAIEDRHTPGVPEDDDTRANRGADEVQEDKAAEGDAQGGAGRPPDDE